MPDSMTQVDRLQELSALLLKMCQEYDMKKFFALDMKFKEIQAIHRLEDELNAS